MTQVVDNLIAYRVLSMLVKPFVETDAYKMGIIDAAGNNLIKSRDFTTPEQKAAYNYLTRLVFNLKKLLNKLPGGDNMTKNLVAAFFLIKEAYQTRSVRVDEHKLEKLITLMNNGVILAQEQLVVEEFLTVLQENVPANATGSAIATDAPVIRRTPRRFAQFTVNDDLYNKFSAGRAKSRKWSDCLNLEDEGQKMIYDFATTNPTGIIILRNGKNSKAIRSSRRGGGSWSKLNRPVKQVNNGVM